MGFVGFILFWVAGMLDMTWHSFFGFEVDIEALLSPTHLLLATAGVLMVGAPIRARGAALTSGGVRTWRTAGPLVIPTAMAVAILGAFTQYVHPFVDAWAAALPGDVVTPTAQLYAMAADGSGQRRLTIVPGHALGPAWSPDGARIVYAYQPGPDDVSGLPAGIRSMAPDGSNDHPLVTGYAGSGPAWSPDGQQIAFSAEVDGQLDLFLMRADGTDVRRLTDDPASDWGVAWVPDGRTLLFISDRGGGYHIHRFDLATGQVAPVTSGPWQDYDPAISPDGTRLAFTSDRRGGGRHDVWLADIDGGSPSRLTNGEDVGDSYMPTWSPDGSTIAFTSNRTGDLEVFTMPVTSGAAVNLSRNPGADDGWARAAWSPDGMTIVYPSTGNVPYWRVPPVRQGFGAAGILVSAAVLAGALVHLRRRYGTLPVGAYGVVIGVPLALVTVLRDEYRLLPGILAAALIVELIVRRWPAGANRTGDALVAFLVPAVVFSLYFATIAVTDGIGWTIHLWMGAIVIAGIIGLLLDELGRPATVGGTARPP